MALKNPFSYDDRDLRKVEQAIRRPKDERQVRRRLAAYFTSRLDTYCQDHDLEPAFIRHSFFTDFRILQAINGDKDPPTEEFITRAMKDLPDQVEAANINKLIRDFGYYFFAGEEFAKERFGELEGYIHSDRSTGSDVQVYRATMAAMRRVDPLVAVLLTTEVDDGGLLDVVREPFPEPQDLCGAFEIAQNGHSYLFFQTRLPVALSGIRAKDSGIFDLLTGGTKNVQKEMARYFIEVALEPFLTELYGAEQSQQ
jgi:hypothetical protein